MIPLFAVIIFAAIAFYEVKKAMRNYDWRNAAAFLLLLAAGFLLSVLQFLYIDIPDPTKQIVIFVQDVLGLNYYKA